MAKGLKRGNGGKKKVQSMEKPFQKPQSEDARKMKNINTIDNSVPALSWTSDDDDSLADLDQTLPNQDKASFEATQSNLSRWIDLIRTPGPFTSVIVQPSPHPMKNLVSNPSNQASSSWR